MLVVRQPPMVFDAARRICESDGDKGRLEKRHWQKRMNDYVVADNMVIRML